MTTHSSSYDWIPEVKPSLKTLDSIPLTGAAPPFPWKDLSARLARSFDCEALVLQPAEVTWRARETLYEGLGDSPVPLTFSIPSLKGQVTWVMPQQELFVLAALLLAKESHPLTLQDRALSESFYHFLALEVLYHFTQLSFDQTLMPILSHRRDLPNEDALCRDIVVHVQHQTISGRLIISPEFRHSWVEHFARKQQPSALSKQMAQGVDVIVHLEAGHVELSLAEWNSVQAGDAILLDRCSLDAARWEGRVILTIHGRQLFRAKLKSHTLKILELPLLREVEMSMTRQPDDEDDLSDLDLNEEEHASEEEDFFSDSEEDLFSEEASDGSVIGNEETPRFQKGKSSHITAEQIPVTLVVEVGQVQMTMEQLLTLEPGNLLDINIHPEEGVDLTIHGKVVGKGELVRIGEAIGVRVFQLGR